MAAHGITFAALLLALAALTHAADDAAHKNDARLFYDDSNTSVTIGQETLSYVAVVFVGVLLLGSLLGLFGTSAKFAKPFDYASTTAYGAPAYDEKVTFVQQLIDDAVNKFL